MHLGLFFAQVVQLFFLVFSVVWRVLWYGIVWYVLYGNVWYDLVLIDVVFAIM